MYDMTPVFVLGATPLNILPSTSATLDCSAPDCLDFEHLTLDRLALRILFLNALLPDAFHRLQLDVAPGSNRFQLDAGIILIPPVSDY